MDALGALRILRKPPCGHAKWQSCPNPQIKQTKTILSNLTALITYDEFKKMGEKDTKREQEALNQAALVQCQIGKNMEDSTKKDWKYQPWKL